jgi:ABC-type sulfate/molybdate transport systems ATPase subunit
MICTTHHQIKAIPMAHRIVAFSKGRIEQTLPPMGQYCPPATRFGDTSDGLTLAPIGTQVCCHSGRMMRRLAAPAQTAQS